MMVSLDSRVVFPPPAVAERSEMNRWAIEAGGAAHADEQKQKGVGHFGRGTRARIMPAARFPRRRHARLHCSRIRVRDCPAPGLLLVPRPFRLERRRRDRTHLCLA